MSIYNWLVHAKNGLFGSRYANRLRLKHKSEDRFTSSTRLKQAIPNDESNRPIFVLSAGWRSGSTLVQRLLMSDRSCFIWGEPYDRSGIVQKLARSLAPIGEEWPPDSYYYSGKPGRELSTGWIANLYPSLELLLTTHRNFFRTLFAHPLGGSEAYRWGMKEVRFGKNEIEYLSFLYPSAKFVLVVRDPTKAFLSYTRFSAGQEWYADWPQNQVATPYRFGRHWSKLASEFLDMKSDPRVFLLRYEDLIEDVGNVDRLADFLGLRLDVSILNASAGATQAGNANEHLDRLSRLLLRIGCAGIRAKYGYR